MANTIMPSAHLEFIAVGQGTTATHAVHGAFCRLAAAPASVHWAIWCNDVSVAQWQAHMHAVHTLYLQPQNHVLCGACCAKSANLSCVEVEAYLRWASAFFDSHSPLAPDRRYLAQPEQQLCACYDWLRQRTNLPELDARQWLADVSAAIRGVVHSGVGAVTDTPYANHLDEIVEVADAAAAANGHSPPAIVLSVREAHSWAARRIDGVHRFDAVCRAHIWPALRRRGASPFDLGACAREQPHAPLRKAITFVDALAAEDGLAALAHAFELHSDAVRQRVRPRSRLAVVSLVDGNTTEAALAAMLSSKRNTQV